MVTLAKVKEDELSAAYKLGRGLRGLGDVGPFPAVAQPPFDPYAPGTPAARIQEQMPTVGEALVGRAATAVDLQTAIPRGIARAGGGFLRGLTGADPQGGFAPRSLTELLALQSGVQPEPTAVAPPTGLTAPAAVTPSSLVTPAEDEPQWGLSPGRTIAAAPLPAPTAPTRGFRAPLTEADIVAPGRTAAAAPLPTPVAPAAPEFTGIHAARDEAGYVVPSKFRTIEEAEEMRKFREELTRTDQPNVTNILQRDPTTGEYWTQEFMQGGAVGAPAAAGLRKDISQARLAEAQAEAVPATTETLTGLRGAQTELAEAQAKAAGFKTLNVDVPTGTVDLVTGKPATTKKQILYNSATGETIDPAAGGVSPRTTTSSVLANFNALTESQQSIVNKHFEGSAPGTVSPEEMDSFMATLK